MSPYNKQQESGTKHETHAQSGQLSKGQQTGVQ